MAAIELLLPETAPRYVPLLVPSLRANLAPRLAEGQVVAVGAMDLLPSGVAAAKWRPDGQAADVRWLFVTPDERRRGLGTALLTHLEAELAKRGCRNLYITYPEHQAPPVQRVLTKCGWEAPRAISFLCRFPISATTGMDWLHRDLRRLPEMEIFLWAEATEADHAQARALIENGDVSARQASPWLDPNPFEPLNSLGLHSRGELAGWFITHRPLPDLVRYTACYVHPTVRLSGAGIAMIARSYQIQCDAVAQLGAPRQALFCYMADNVSMRRFVPKYFAPYGSLEEERVAQKEVNSSRTPDSQ